MWRRKLLRGSPRRGVRSRQGGSRRRSRSSRSRMLRAACPRGRSAYRCPAGLRPSVTAKWLGPSPCCNRCAPGAGATVGAAILCQDREELELDRCQVDHLASAAHCAYRERLKQSNPRAALGLRSQSPVSSALAQTVHPRAGSSPRSLPSHRVDEANRRSAHRVAVDRETDTGCLAAHFGIERARVGIPIT